MGKAKYYYNPRTLSYQEVSLSGKQKLIKVMGYLSISIVLSLFLLIILSRFLDSPEERLLKREVHILEEQIALMNDDMAEMEQVLDELEMRDENIYRVITESEPLSKNVRQMGTGGTDQYAGLSNFQSKELITSTKTRLDELKKKLWLQSKSLQDLVHQVKNKQQMLASIPAIQPIANKELKRLTSGFGHRIDPIYKTRKFHYGMDFSAPAGTPVYSTGDGKIIAVKRMQRSFGYHIIIDHGYGYQTLYAHLQRFNVKAGEKVKRGQIIGFVGNTGKSTAPHLHYEVVKDGIKANPVYFMHNDIPDDQFQKLVEMAMLNNQSFD